MTNIAKQAQGLICKMDKPEFAGLEILHNFTELIDRAALACIIFKHLIEFLFIIAGDTVRQNINGITDFGHIVTGGFYASSGICNAIICDRVRLCSRIFLSDSFVRLISSCLINIVHGFSSHTISVHPPFFYTMNHYSILICKIK